MKKVIASTLGIVVLGLVLAMVLSVRLGEPGLSRTELEIEDLELLARAYSELERSRPDPARVDLSLNQASYLLERNPPDEEWYGWSIAFISLEPAGDNVMVSMVLEGPMNLYGRLTAEGILRLDNDRWTMQVEQTHLGYLPLTVVVPEAWPLDLPVAFLNGRLRLLEATVDGTGIEALVRLGEPLEEDPIGDLLPSS